MDVKEWDEKVEAFIEENQELADDPTLGQSAAQRLLQETTNLLVPLMNEVTELLNRTERAANNLTNALSDPHCSAGKVHKREKEYERLKAQREELRRRQDELEALREKMHDVYMTRVSEPEISHLDFTPEKVEDVPKPSFWQRLFR